MAITKEIRKRLLLKVAPEDKLDILVGELQDEIKQVANKPTKDYSAAILLIGEELRTLSLKISQLPSSLEEIKKNYLEAISKLNKQLDGFAKKSDIPTTVDYSGDIKALDEKIGQVKKLTGRGGGIHRRITVSGVDPLTLYTDINYKAGSGISLATANDLTNKRVDITFTGTPTTITSSDIEITDFNHGLILTSADGSRWRVTINNTGNLQATLL